jgi:glycine betaine/choline ABC-type transport system substrate-binding protein
MSRGALAALLSFLATAGLARAAPAPHAVVIGAKNFTEGAVLGEVMAQVLEAQAGLRVERRFNLAGTKVAFDALRAGEIDAYAEYTGTGLRDILHDPAPVAGAAQAFATVSTAFRERFDLQWLAPFGFNNTFS